MDYIKIKKYIFVILILFCVSWITYSSGFPSDFIIDYNSPILAACDGEVVAASANATEGGDDEKFAKDEYNNWITIKHANEEYSYYCHLAHKSLLVKRGDVVRTSEGQSAAWSDERRL